MLELLKRFEEEAIESSDEEEDTDDLVSRVQGIDLGAFFEFYVCTSKRSPSPR